MLFLLLDAEDCSDARMSEIFAPRAAYLVAQKVDPVPAKTLPYARVIESRVGEIGPARSADPEKVLAANPKAAGRSC